MSQKNNPITSKIQFLFFTLIISFGILGFAKSTEAATSIFRSASPQATAALSTSTAANVTLTISGATATFSAAQPNNIGVGDAIQYDSDNNGSIDSIAFIHGRASSTEYTVKNASGTNATSTTAADADWSIFRAYTSLSNAEAGIENASIASALRNFDDWTAGGTATTDDIGKDLITADQQWNIALYANGTLADTYARLDGWTASTTQYVRLYTPYLSSEVGVSQRHNGKWDPAKYKIEMNGVTALEVREDYTRVDGIQMQVTQTADVTISALVLSAGFTSGASTFISNNIIVGSNLSIATALHRGMNISTTGHNYYLWNNIVYGFNANSNGYGIYRTNGNLYVYNTLAYSNYNGIRGATVCKNCVSFNNTGLDFTSSIGIDHSATDDGVGTNPVVPADWSAVFVDYLNNDFHLKSTDTSLRDHGVNPSDANVPFNTDIDGEVRFDSTWDIGPDEYIGAPDTTPPTISFIASSTSPTSATIAWNTSELATSTVNYGLTTSYGSASTSNTFVTSQSIVLTGLTPSTLYNFKVTSSDTSGNIASSTNYTFTTPAADTTAPTITSVASSTGLTTAIITWNTNEPATSTVNYGLTTSYGSASSSGILATSHSIALTGLTAGTLYHFKVSSADESGNVASTTDYTFTTPASDTTGPIISAVASTTAQTTATINWTTNELSTSRVQYGLNASYGSQTTLDSSLIASHSMSLSGLTASTTYHFRVISMDASGNTSTSTDYTLTTLPQPPKAWSYVAVPYTDWEYDPFTHPSPTRPNEWPSAAKQDYYFIEPNNVNATDVVSGGEPVDANGKRFGYPNKPRKTLPIVSKNFNSYPAGTVFWLKGGDYDTVYGTGDVFNISSLSTPDKPFWVYGDPDDKPIFRNARITLYNSSYGFIENIIWDDGTKGSGSMSFGRPDAEGDTHHITVRNVSVQNRRYVSNSGHFAVAGPGETVVNGDIHDIVFYKINFKNNGGGVNWDLEDADMHGYKLNGIWNQNRTYRIWIIENTVLKGDTPDPIDGFYKSLAGNFVQVGDQKVTEGNVDHVWIAGNYGEGMRQGCAGAKRSGSVVVSSNICKDLAQTETSQGQAFNIKYDRQENLWFVNNYVEHVDSFIIRAETTSSGAGGPDTFNKLDTRVHIIGNVFKDTMREPWNAPDMGGIGGWKTKGISIQDMNGKVYIANNVIDTSVYGVYFDPHSNRQSVGSEMHVYNNIAINLSAGLDTSTAANNGIMITTKGASEWFIENNFVENGRYYFSGVQYNSAAEFNARANAEGNMQGDPMFTNAAAGDYTLLPGSPAIDAGAENYTTNGSPDVYQLFIDAFANDPDFPGNPADVWPKDRNNNPRLSGSRIDMGAYEFQQASTGDATPPTVTLTSPANGASVSGNISLSATASDDVGISRVTFYADDIQVGNYVSSAPYTISLNTVSLSNGAHTIKAIARDQAGNQTTSQVSTINVSNVATDVTAPTLAQVTPVSTPTSDTNPPYTFSSTEAGTITYGGACSSATTNAASGNNTIMFNTLANGTYSNCTIRVTDASSNMSAPLAVSAFTVDTVTPDTIAPTITSVASSTGLTTATITWNTNEQATSSVSYGLTTSYGMSSSSPLLRTAHSITLTGLTPSTVYNFRVSSADESDNASSSGNYTFVTATPDTTAPIIGSVSTSTTQTTAEITWSTNEAATSTINYGPTTSYGMATTSNLFLTSRTMTLTDLIPGTVYHFRIVSADPSGNSTSSADYTFTTVATPPVFGGGGGGGGSGGGYVAVTAPAAAQATSTATTTVAIGGTATSSVLATSTAGFYFTRDLRVGARGTDVAALQRYLNANGFLVALSGVGSKGKETEYFGAATQRALGKFQAARGITPAAGFFGAKTRAVVNGSVPVAEVKPVMPATSAGIIVKLGSSGPYVKLLRTKLRALGYLEPYGTTGTPASAAAETDYFGSVTETVLRKFQCDKGIVCSGSVASTGWGSTGPKTRAALGI